MMRTRRPVGGPSTAALGNEMQLDSVDLFMGSLPPASVFSDPATSSTLVTPIGPDGGTLQLLQFHAPLDLFHIRKGTMGPPITQADTELAAGVVYINATTPGEVLKVDLQYRQSTWCRNAASMPRFY